MSQRTPALGEPTASAERQESAEVSDSPPRQMPVLLAFLGLVGVFLLGAGSVLFAPEGSDVAVWWPAAGLGVALLVLAPSGQRWTLALGIVIASGLANFMAGRSPVTALGFGLANGAEAYVVAWLLTRGVRGRPSLRTMEDLWRLVYSTLAGNLVVAVGIGLTVTYGLDGSFPGAAGTVFASHAAAILIIVPLALRVGPSSLAGRELEAVAQWFLLVASVAYVFRPDQVLSLTFLPLPVLVWAALRFGLRTVSYQLLAVGVATTTLTAAGGGPFALGTATGITTAATTASLVQAFLIVTALVALPLAVAVDQRRIALVRMSQREELFRKSFSESFVGMLMLYLAPDGLRIRELNQTAADILGGPAEDFEDQPLQRLLETGTKLKDVARQMVAGETAGWREEMWLANEPGRRVGLALSPMSTSAEEAMFSAQLIDVTDVHVAATRLQTEKDFTAAVLNTTAALIVVVDVDGAVAGINPACQRTTGLTEAEVLDKPLWQTLVPARDARQLREMLDRTRPGRDAPAFEGDLLSSTEGGRRRVVWSSAPLTNDAGRRTHVVLTGIDVTEERNVRSMTNHLLDSATSTAFIGLNLRGTITIFNAGAQELLGYTASEVTGRLRLDSLHDPQEVAALAGELGTEPGFPTIVAGVDSAPQTRDWTYLRKDGSRVACAITLSAVRDAFGSHIGYLAVGRDVTESRRNQKILMETLDKERAAVERLRDLDRAKSDFVSMVSHELRTPITSIVGYTEMLLDGAAGPVAPEQHRLLDAVRRNGVRLVALIEDLLTLSRIESGTFTLEKSAVDLRTVFEKAHEALEPMLVGRKLDVHFELPDLPVQVMGDPRQLERMIVNLLGNAVKFTDDGGRVAWSLTATTDEAHFRVADTGIGIPEGEQPALFSRFFRSTTAQERAIQGTGLGLTIVQSIVQSHGGEITIRSREHVGTDVEVVLPLSRTSFRLDSGA
ncbi:MAG TPA: PAS domain S-box protein [Nocardioidaceae bacterium]|nr:PAS domain S-box protein [Nocardioidaceae bacterium]